MEMGTNASSVWIWCLFTAIFFPDFLQFIHSSIIVFTKGLSTVTGSYVITSLLIQIIHTFGMCVLMFIALPNLPAVEMLPVMSCICLIPALLNFVSDMKDKGNNNSSPPEVEKKNDKSLDRNHSVHNYQSEQKSNTLPRYLKLGFAVICIVIQFGGMIYWTVIKSLDDHPQYWSLIVGPLCTSFGWWQVFMNPFSKEKKK